MSFDPMAAAVDWLDAYRAGDIETILGMYADDAVIHCGCGGMKTRSGKDGRRAYWRDRLRDYPATSLNDLKPSGDTTVISYIASGGVVSASLSFNAHGQIASHVCGPSN
ncbi:nuclear transport factor 2 family protein [Bradyrhizobium sp. 182]|uniref:nuclear transport factor 2 family protein n=1 Tax=unclassified Bradyrhizobium TaxID=2631580 RepID=UPI001FFBC1E7|nr:MULTISPECIES: nuclear transport factor 2 family protein [unclassified Bradyrhizobium]MCK1424249.1 nuclear transport factor 2 family protein [Bradyrhizobium sp. CW12]MCK1528458.1 nuclear transport factor 2 family protein [Bradyrhizobium sp. 182]MCK1597098.1 nuclear transport factor 2 family protein [Bradyrhizobium sp. 164]MCK1647011.1 nuclear transport factor 2 family protein [Bradyrhizobium sp. 154]